VKGTQMKKYWSQTKFGEYYLRTIETITLPFVKLHNYAIEVRTTPEFYYTKKFEKKVTRFLKKAGDIKTEDKLASFYALKAAQYALWTHNEALYTQLEEQVERLRKPATQEQKELIETLASQFTNLLTMNGVNYGNLPG
jgi:aminopeptidase N